VRAVEVEGREAAVMERKEASKMASVCEKRRRSVSVLLGWGAVLAISLSPLIERSGLPSAGKDEKTEATAEENPVSAAAQVVASSARRGTETEVFHALLVVPQPTDLERKETDHCVLPNLKRVLDAPLENPLSPIDGDVPVEVGGGDLAVVRLGDDLLRDR
jgi:hypothetical protein